MARWTCRSFPYISTVFATALQKLTAENAARSAAQCAPYSSSSQRFAWSSEQRSGQGIPLFPPSMLRSSFDYGRICARIFCSRQGRCPCCGPAAVRWSRKARNDHTVFYPCACAYGMVETHDFFLTLCSFIGRGTLFRVPGQLLSGGRLDLAGVRGENAGKQNFFCFFAVLRLLWCFF